MNPTYDPRLPFFNDAVAGTVVQLKATQGGLFYLKLVNTTAAVAYLQVFFKPSAGVTLGTTIADYTVRLAANESISIPELGGLGLISGASPGSGLSAAGTTTATGLTGAAISVSATYG